MADNTAGNGKVSTTEFFKALMDMRKEMSEMERRILERIDCIQAPALSQRVDGMDADLKDIKIELKDVRDDIKQVRAIANWWNGANTLGALVATIRAFLGP